MSRYGLPPHVENPLFVTSADAGTGLGATVNAARAEPRPARVMVIDPAPALAFTGIVQLNVTRRLAIGTVFCVVVFPTRNDPVHLLTCALRIAVTLNGLPAVAEA